MAKLYFRYGTVNCGKSTRLVTEVHNDRASGRQVLILKSAVDTRWSTDHIVSRVPGLSVTVDAVVAQPADVYAALAACPAKPAFIYFDEAHFAPRAVIEALRNVATAENIPVICYGLRTTWQLELFEGAAALFALADKIEPVKSICAAWNTGCTKCALVNMKHQNQKPVRTGPTVELGAEDMYASMCHHHYTEFMH